MCVCVGDVGVCVGGVCGGEVVCVCVSVMLVCVWVVCVGGMYMYVCVYMFGTTNKY